MSGPFLDHRSFQCLSRFVRGRSVLLIALRLEQGSGFAVSEIDPIGQGPNDPPAIGTGLSAGSDFELLDRTLARVYNQTRSAALGPKLTQQAESSLLATAL